ncbi:MAG: uroporphyrinogen decarboxylase family protein, partial [Armatimonadota bacterium]
VDMMVFGDDLGTQTSTILSPNDFRKWIKPGYTKLMEPCRKAGTLVFFHSDGRTLDILEDQIAAGVDIVNPQDLANGVDNIAKYIKSKACICLDIDRQTIVPFGTRKDIHDLIEEEVRKLGDPSGGLEMVAGIYPPTSPDNVDALCEALMKYQTFWWD